MTRMAGMHASNDSLGGTERAGSALEPPIALRKAMPSSSPRLRWRLVHFLMGIAGSLSLLIGACSSIVAPSGGDASQTPTASYAICSDGATTLYRVDSESMTCTFVVLVPVGGSCPSSVMIGDQCFTSAGMSKDVAACDALQIPTTGVMASSASGTFTTRVEDPAGGGHVAVELAEFDLTLTFFPSDAGFPTSQHLVGTKCPVACTRPISYCGP
jgi:hypothetical protein